MKRTLGIAIYPLVCVLSLALLPLQPQAEALQLASEAGDALLQLIALAD